MPSAPIKRLWRIALCFLLLGAAAFPGARAEQVKILVQSSPLAGSQYYAVAELWPRLVVGDRLTLVREADNHHDPRAVRVDWQGQPLGYLPRAENSAVAAALDRGEKLEARIARLTQDANPWRRVEVQVFVVL
ncbi:MAG TPA: HIRAN domain-containing protein [Azospira sp.]|nr:HIRAN domain-containing protein [Azospira sp.]